MNEMRQSGAWLRRASAATWMACFATAFAVTDAQAQQRGSTTVDLGNAAAAEAVAVREYWTPERLRGATRIMPTVSNTPAAGAQAPAAAAAGASASSPGAAPSVARTAALEEAFIPPGAAVSQEPEPMAGSAPALSDGSYGPFTTSRVFPDAALSAYPYSTAGKLYFTDPRTRLNYVCSASVLRQRIVATAGHCVTKASTSASGRYFYTNFIFIPGMANGTGPWGSWTPSSVTVANAWYLSSGAVPNSGDWGYLVMRDRAVNGATRKIGAVTGYLGYKTLGISNNNVTMIGYPCNLDSCNRMEYTNATVNRFGGVNTYIYPSAMRGGASGGPWIQDFGVAPVSSPSVPLARNYLVAVTSYGPVSTSFYYLGASQFDSTWLNILNSVCGSASTGNC